jgi:hypothetical protein
MAMIVNPEVLNQHNVSLFRNGLALPPGYGTTLNERCIELPWTLATLAMYPSSARLLDAGATLNYREILTIPAVADKKIHIATLSSTGEENNMDLGVSYILGDLAALPTEQCYYDVVACISTLEHVGMDNSRYGGPKEHDTNKWKRVLDSLRDATEKNGTLLITVPFGKYQDDGWFQQFDAGLLRDLLIYMDYDPDDEVVEYFAATPQGWTRSTAALCAGNTYDHSRGRASSIACLKLTV